MLDTLVRAYMQAFLKGDSALEQDRAEIHRTAHELALEMAWVGDPRAKWVGDHPLAAGEWFSHRSSADYYCPEGRDLPLFPRSW